tara:strand:+ start:2174 stop:2503 length:330 start_codon:yes stop_codon:yes gene_type:complete
MNTGNSPYSTGFIDKSIKHDQGTLADQTAKYKQDEAGHKADLELPHELAGIDRLLGDTFVSLMTIRKMLDHAQQNEEISQHTIDVIKEKIDTISEIVLDIPDDLAKIGI